jgi:hypothetical protein
LLVMSSITIRLELEKLLVHRSRHKMGVIDQNLRKKLTDWRLKLKRCNLMRRVWVWRGGRGCCCSNYKASSSSSSCYRICSNSNRESLMLMPRDGDGSAHLPTKEWINISYILFVCGCKIKLQDIIQGVLIDINLKKSQPKQSISLVVIPATSGNYYYYYYYPAASNNNQ